MVLHGRLCGRVGRRRTTIHESPPLWGWAFVVPEIFEAGLVKPVLGACSTSKGVRRRAPWSVRRAARGVHGAPGAPSARRTELVAHRGRTPCAEVAQARQTSAQPARSGVSVRPRGGACDVGSRHATSGRACDVTPRRATSGCAVQRPRTAARRTGAALAPRGL
jgi:hypothetical protein